MRGVVGGEREGQAPRKEGGKGVAVVIQEQAVVGQRAHAQPDLAKEEEVLQRRALAQVDAVRDVLAQQQRAYQVIDVARLACSTNTTVPWAPLNSRNKPTEAKSESVISNSLPGDLAIMSGAGRGS